MEKAACYSPETASSTVDLESLKADVAPTHEHELDTWTAIQEYRPAIW